MDVVLTGGGERGLLDRNRLTSPFDGFNVPTKATKMSGQRPFSPANPRPVPNIRTDANNSRRRVSALRATRPTPTVKIAEPTSVAVTIAPTRAPSNPRPVR